jgi:hypothetical protein
MQEAPEGGAGQYNRGPPDTLLIVAGGHQDGMAPIPGIRGLEDETFTGS